GPRGDRKDGKGTACRGRGVPHGRPSTPRRSRRGGGRNLPGVPDALARSVPKGKRRKLAGFERPWVAQVAELKRAGFSCDGGARVFQRGLRMVPGGAFRPYFSIL